jgi:hypothetical protein
MRPWSGSSYAEMALTFGRLPWCRSATMVTVVHLGPWTVDVRAYQNAEEQRSALETSASVKQCPDAPWQATSD